MFEIPCFDSNDNIITHFTQWDMNQVIYIKDWEYAEIPIFHFCNVKSKKSLEVVGEIDNGKIKSKVPNILLTEPYAILGFVFLEKVINTNSKYEETKSGRSIYSFQIPVRKKPQPEGYIFENDIEYVSYESLKKEMYESIDALVAADVGKFWKDSNGNIKGEYFNDYKNNIASGVFSHAEGSNTAAMGAYSHAGGEGTVASLSWQFATGKYNDYTDDTYAFMVGNGTSDAVRSNAMTVDWNGNLKANGDIIGTDVNGNPLSLRDIAEEFVRISDEIQDVVSLPIKYVLSDDGTLTVTGTGDIDPNAIENKEKITTAAIDINGEIGIGAFASCPNLGMATVNCNKICDKAFAACPKLNTFTIGKSVTEIGSEILLGSGFDISVGLSLFYLGTVSEWNAVKKAENWTGSLVTIKDGVVTCSDGAVAV